MGEKKRGEDILAILSIFFLSTPFKDVPRGQLSSRHFAPWENFLIQSFLMKLWDSSASLRVAGAEAWAVSGWRGWCNLIGPQMFMENPPDSIESS